MRLKARRRSDGELGTGPAAARDGELEMGAAEVERTRSERKAAEAAPLLGMGSEFGMGCVEPISSTSKR